MPDEDKNFGGSSVLKTFKNARLPLIFIVWEWKWPAYSAVHCCDPTLSVLVMLVSRNVFHLVSALQSNFCPHTFFWLIRSLEDPTLAAFIVCGPLQFLVIQQLINFWLHSLLVLSRKTADINIFVRDFRPIMSIICEKIRGYLQFCFVFPTALA